jgi:hypothetical protein
MLRYPVTLLVSSLLLLVACSTTEPIPPHELEGFYQGRYIYSWSGILRDSETVVGGDDTLFLQFSIDGQDFLRYLGDTVCVGQVSFTPEQILFSSEDCVCHCFCNPFIDCKSDIILGEYQYQLQDDSLYLTSEGVAIYDSTYLGYFDQQSYHITFELEKLE